MAYDETTAKLIAEIERKDAMLANYRKLVGKLATNRDKNTGWYIAKAWCPFWRDLAFDLETEQEQKAFLFE